MKKIIAIILVVLCAFSLVACGDKDNSTNVLEKLNPTGKRIDRIKALDRIEEREEDYSQSDKAKLENLNVQWFNVDAKYEQNSGSDFFGIVSNSKTLFAMVGVMGYSSDGELLMDVEIVYEEGQLKKKDDKVETDRKNMIEAHVIACDGVAYVDYKKIVYEEGERKTEKAKVMIPVDALDFGELGQVEFEDLYGTGVYKLSRTFIDIETERMADFYWGNDKVFIQIENEDADEDYSGERIIQFEVGFSGQSALVETVRYYCETKADIHMDNHLSTNETRKGFHLIQCEPQTITVPDAGDYE